MRSTPLTLLAGALLVSSSALAHDIVHPGAKHRMVLQVRQDPPVPPTTTGAATPTSASPSAAPTTTTAATSASPSPTSTAAPTTSASPTSTTPTTSSAAPTTTSAAPTTTSAAPTTTSAAPTTTSAAPTTTSATSTSTSAVGPATLSRATSSARTSTGTLPGLVSAASRSSTSARASASAGVKNANAKASSGISKGATVGIVIGVLVGVAALAFFLFRKFKLAKTKKFNRRLQPLDFSAGGMPDEHEFKTTEGAFAAGAGEKRGDSDWERRERERSDLVATLDDSNPAYPNQEPRLAGADDFNNTAYPSYPPQSDAYGYPPQGAYGAGNGYEDQHHPTSYYGDNTAGFGAYGSTQEGAGVQRQPSNGGQYDQAAYQQHDQYMGAYSGEQQPQYGVQRQPSGGAAAYDSYGQHNYANTSDYPPQQPHQQPHQGQGGGY